MLSFREIFYFCLAFAVTVRVGAPTSLPFAQLLSLLRKFRFFSTSSSPISFRGGGVKVCRFPFSTVAVIVLIHWSFPLGIGAVALRVYRVDCFQKLLDVVGVVV